MDYFKAMYLLNNESGILKDNSFLTIYKITRLYIPDILYKYYSLSQDEKLNDKKLLTLQTGKIFMSDINCFNDPFDGKAFYYDANRLMKFERLASHCGKLIDDFASLLKATALTSNGVSSMPMWAHYASNHTGFCVSYDMTDNCVLTSCTYPVQYSDQRLDVTSLMENQASMLSNNVDMQSSLDNGCILIDDLSLVYMPLLLCNIKHKSWSYENEFRCTIAANAPGSPYIEAKPNSIFLGMNCLPKYESRLSEIASSLNIPIHKMGYNEQSPEFELKIMA